MSKARISKKKIMTLGLWLIVILLFWWVGRDLDPAALGRILSRLTIRDMFFLLGINAALFLLFSFRWWWIVRNLGYDRPFIHLVKYRLTAFGITYFTPGPQFGGEPFQVYVLHKREGVPISASVSSVTLDKLAELLANFSFLLIGVVIILRYEFFPGLSRVPILPLVLILLAIPVLYLVVLWSGRHPLAASSKFLIRVKSRSAGVKKFLLAVESAELNLANTWRQQPRLLLVALLLSAATWVGMVLEFRLALQYLGLTLPWPQTIGVLTGARIAFLFPLPGGLGTLEASQVLAMQALGAGTALGVSLSLWIRARDVLLGGLGLALEGTSVLRSPLFNRVRTGFARVVERRK
jgi:uncharacterized protein (TIRG00374 family)